MVRAPAALFKTRGFDYAVLMLSNAQQKQIRSLHTKKGRKESGTCLVEGAKVIEAAKDAVLWRFSRVDVETEKEFFALVTTSTPQEQAAIAKTPTFSLSDIKKSKTIVVLDGVQDPGNVGTILRLCHGFSASVILIDSADVTSPKVVRSSVGSLFQVPWMVVKRGDAEQLISELKRTIYRLERRATSITLRELPREDEIILIAGAEGSGIALPVTGTSLVIPHDPSLESLNVASALAIALFHRYG